MARFSNGLRPAGSAAARCREVAGIPALLLETRGARSGQPRRSTLGYLAEPPDAWLIIASTGGAAWNPAWLHNLAKDPDAIIELGDGRRIEVRAETVRAPSSSGLEADRGRGAVVRGLSAKTDREIPVVRLRRRATA